MRQNLWTVPKTSIKEFALIILTAAGILVVMLAYKGAPVAPYLDAETYARFGLGLSEFGVAGELWPNRPAPAPERGVGPLYPALLALLIEVDIALRDSLLCALKIEPAPGSGCPAHYWTLAVVQGTLMAAFSASVWLCGFWLTGNRAVAWLALVAALGSQQPAIFARQFLTEALALPLFGFLTVFLLLALRQRHRLIWPVLAGVTVGLLALTKPSFAYLFWFLLALGAVMLALQSRRRMPLVALLLFALAYGGAVGPWMARNAYHFGSPALTAGYGANALAQRISYNRMQPVEWAVAFVYWFPDIGDEIATSLFPLKTYEKLGGGPKSYFQYGAHTLFESTRRLAGGADNHLRYLIETEVLGHPIKHLLVSIPLAWRGMFVKAYWSIFAWFCTGWLLWRTIRRSEWTFSLLCAPAFFLLAFHAGVSVSIPRYNIVLIPVLSIAMAVAVLEASQGLLMRYRGSPSTSRPGSSP